MIGEMIEGAPHPDLPSRYQGRDQNRQLRQPCAAALAVHIDDVCQ